MTLNGATDNDKLRDLSSRTYKEQAVWFLNSFWKDFGEKESERIWNYKHEIEKLDLQKGKEGSAVDEMIAHRFLEVFKETLTVKEMREKLYGIGIDRPKLISLVYYLIFRYNVDWHYLVNAPQGDNQEEVAKAQRMLEEVQKAFVEMQKAAEASAQREKEAKAAEQASKEAKAELEKSLAELKAQEDAYNNKTEELKRKTTEGGVVSQNKAKAELAQHLAEDPLPLRRAKINTEAAVKKAERTAKAAEEATAAAVAARKAAEKAVEDTAQRVAEAEAYLHEVRSKPGSAGGALWWIDRELHEARAYLPASKGGYKKTK